MQKLWHTAKEPIFAVCNDQGTWQRLSLCRVPGTGGTRQTSPATSAWQPAKNVCCGSARAHDKAFVVCPIYCTRQRGPLPTAVCRVPFAVCGTRQTFFRGLLGLCRVPLAHGKRAVSRSAITHHSRVTTIGPQRKRGGMHLP